MNSKATLLRVEVNRLTHFVPQSKLKTPVISLNLFTFYNKFSLNLL